MRIYYFMDVMCGWCYALSDVMARISDRYRDRAELIIVPGGMWARDKIYTSERLERNIKASFEEIKAQTSAGYGDGYARLMSDYGRELESISGSLAINAFSHFNREDSYKYAAMLQKALFVDGRDLSDEELFVELAEKLGVKASDFRERYHSEENKVITDKGFEMVFEWKVRVFPSIYVYDEGSGEKVFVMDTKGDFEDISKRLDVLLG